MTLHSTMRGLALMLAQPHHRAVQAKSHNAAANTVYDSTEFAGWAADTPHGLASVSTTFKIPTLNCSTDIDDPLYLGTGTNTGSAYSTIRLLCNVTTPTYTYWLATPAGPIEEPGAAAGDVVVVSLFQTASWTEAEIHDVTNGEYWVADTAARESTRLSESTSRTPLRRCLRSPRRRSRR